MLLPQRLALGDARGHCGHRAGLAWITMLQPACLFTGVVASYQKAEGVNCIAGCKVEFDPCNKPSNSCAHLLLFLPLLWSKDLFFKKRICHQHELKMSSGNLRLCFSHISCTGKFAIKMTLLWKPSFPITKLSVRL